MSLHQITLFQAHPVLIRSKYCLWVSSANAVLEVHGSIWPVKWHAEIVTEQLFRQDGRSAQAQTFAGGGRQKRVNL